MIQPTLRSQKDAPGKDDFAKLTYHICRDTAKEILGGELSHVLLKGTAGPEKVKTAFGDSQEVGGSHELAKKLVTDDMDSSEAKSTMEAGEDKSSTRVGKEYGKETLKPTFDAREAKLGINKYANAKVGQGYVTQSIFNKSGTKKDYSKSTTPTNQFVWGYHFSSVVTLSEDKDDQIAMENYNRELDIKEAQKELLQKLKHKICG